ncbi:phosphoribosyltransferase-like protein [Achromobacter xylosoxidans]|uniref:phosphoribosyltransferase-like protein n=1 Tax=Alcaligenes xylosoxydans xylosoxydans TaxID=85698 RepID=UPI000AA81ECF|nr:hypothetical protein [Achromobacter xylosoxidans]
MERDERLFIDGTKVRVQKLIRCGAWEGMDLGRFESWFNQFVGRRKELLGACLLDNFIFRGKGQVEALLKAALSNPAMLPPTARWDGEVIEALGVRHIDPGIRLAPVIRLDQSPTKSGTYVLRRLAKSLRIQDKWMLWPQSLVTMPDSVHTVILVDDFCGSGKQFSEFVKLTEIEKVMLARPQCRIVYLTVAAHSDGIKKVKEEFARVEFIAGEVLTPLHGFFGGERLARIKVENVEERLKEDYDSIASEVNLGGKIGPYGFEAQGLTYAFDHGTPNNTLPIYWYTSENWTPLVNR